MVRIAVATIAQISAGDSSRAAQYSSRPMNSIHALTSAGDGHLARSFRLRPSLSPHRLITALLEVVCRLFVGSLFLVNPPL
jgi:hypothetical protein